MKGVNYLIDEKGTKTAVVINLNEYGRIWENFHDIMISNMREKEDKISWKSLKAEMKEQGEL